MGAFQMTLRSIATAFAGRHRRPTPSSPTDPLSLPDISVAGLSIMKVPDDENELIALWYELIGKGRINDIRTYHLSQNDTYDGKFLDKQPGSSTWPTPRSASDLKTLEFKISLYELMKEFDDQTKSTSHIQLAIVWQDDYTNRSSRFPDYDVVNLALTPLDQHVIPVVGKCIHDRSSGEYVPLVIVKELVDNIGTVTRQSTRRRRRNI